MKKILFFDKARYEASLECMKIYHLPLVQKVYSAYSPYKLSPLDLKKTVAICEGESAALLGMIDAEIREQMKKDRKANPLAKISFEAYERPTLAEIEEELHYPKAMLDSHFMRMREEYRWPVAEISFIDFDPITGEPSFGERGMAEIREKCTFYDTPRNREIYEAQTELRDAVAKAHRVMNKYHLKGTPIINSQKYVGFPLTSLLIENQDNLEINGLLFE